MSTTFQRRSADRRRSPRRQRGTVAILVGVAIFALIGMLGLVMDLGNLYVRKTELQNAADAAALAGVKQLDGKATGIDAAVAAAIAIAGANASDFGKTAVAIADAQIRFGPSPDGPWLDVATAKGNPPLLSFVKVDTTGIAQETRATWFIWLVGAAAASTAHGVAVAGSTLCDALPIFICQVPFGFTPGQSYFFAEKPGYPIGPGNIGYFDPVPPGAPGLISGANDMRDIICAGKMQCLPAPGTYNSLTQNAFGTMARAVNTRFDEYSGLPASLTPERCPPDTNIKEYRYDNELKTPPASNPTAWMTPIPDHQSEQDPGAVLGVHWSAVRPAILPGVPAVNGKYPSAGSGGGTPYTQPVGSVFQTQPSAPHRIDALDKRRIITLAIVDNCGAINGSGKPVHVIGYGKFFLSVKAVGTGGNKGIYVEYIEIMARAPVSAPDVKLYR